MFSKDELRYKDPQKRRDWQKNYKRGYMKKYRKLNPDYLKNETKKRRKRIIERKKEAIRIKGGSCSTCDYSKNLAALEFHHINGKDIHWSEERAFLHWNRRKFLEELEKVILICANCHKELHHPHLAI